MKIKLAVLSLMISTLSFAQVEDSDKFLRIGKLESMVIKQSLNIKANTGTTQIGDSECYLHHDKVDYPRTLTAPKSLNFVSSIVYNITKYRVAEEIIGIEFEGLKSASRIYCNTDKYHPNVTFGDMKRYLNGTVELNHLAPTEIE
ncbi:MAG: hypothetical protein VYA54_03085 [Bdellovibrionota bacterium]|nr:hypothetical protein [Bdellovibrionota bacterium]